MQKVTWVTSCDCVSGHFQKSQYNSQYTFIIPKHRCSSYYARASHCESAIKHYLRGNSSDGTARDSPPTFNPSSCPLVEVFCHGTRLKLRVCTFCYFHNIFFLFPEVTDEAQSLKCCRCNVSIIMILQRQYCTLKWPALLATFVETIF